MINQMEVIDYHGLEIKTAEIVEFLKQQMSLKEVCHRIVCERIIEQAATSRSVVVTPEEIQTETEEIRHARRLEKASDTLAWLKEEMITVDEWEIAIKKRLVSQKLAQQLFEQEAEPYFNQNRLDFEQLIVYQIIVPYQRLAQEIFYQIEEEEICFYEAAHLYNLNEQHRYVCGYQGKINRWSFEPNVAAILFRDPLPLGELLGPIQTEQGYHLFKVEEYIKAELTLERKQEIIDKLFKQWLSNEFNYALHS
ncbi:MAG: peptidylprolyl isomerase [Xenococcus sp. MO_188.B8]|nr:peptidylprolyl isomerase [Xenococcus sp. MO_188.B8]